MTSFSQAVFAAIVAAIASYPGLANAQGELVVQGTATGSGSINMGAFTITNGDSYTFDWESGTGADLWVNGGLLAWPSADLTSGSGPLDVTLNANNSIVSVAVVLEGITSIENASQANLTTSRIEFSDHTTDEMGFCSISSAEYITTPEPSALSLSIVGAGAISLLALRRNGVSSRVR